MSQQRSTQDSETHREPEELGLDVASTIRHAEAISYSETLLGFVGKLDSNKIVSPEIRNWAEKLANDSLIPQDELLTRIKWLIVISGTMLVIACGAFISLAFDIISSDLGRMVGVFILLFSSLLFVSALYVISQLLWSAYLFERILRGMACQQVAEMRELWIASSQSGLGNAVMHRKL